MNEQLRGIEDIGGLHLFDVRVAVRRIRLNRLLWLLTRAEEREKFRADEAAACRKAGLDDLETRLVLARDWVGLIRIGANFFALEKLIRLTGKSNLEIYAAQRGETLEEYLKTRRVPDAV